MTVERLAGLIASARKLLYDAREKRVHPGLDDKVLASWNGLAQAAFAEAGRVLGRADYIAAAVKNAELVTAHMKDGDRLLRSWKDGQAKIKGYLEDYAMVGAGLLALYEATFDRRWLDDRAGWRSAPGALPGRAGGMFFRHGRTRRRSSCGPATSSTHAVPSGTSVASVVC